MFSRQEQCGVLVELMREYYSLKTSINSTLESAEAISDISSVLQDHEETKRSLSKVSHLSSITNILIMSFRVLP